MVGSSSNQSNGPSSTNTTAPSTSQSSAPTEMVSEENGVIDTDPSVTDITEVAKALNVNPEQGLSDEEVQRRLERFGPNELAAAPPVPK